MRIGPSSRCNHTSNPPVAPVIDRPSLTDCGVIADHGSQDVRAGLRANWGDTDVIITSFEICMRDIKFFQNPRFSNRSGTGSDQQWKYLAVDEGQ